MSKSLGNIFDPWEALDRQGADALRWFMITSGSPWESRRIGHEVLDEIVRQFLLTLWNVYAFFVTYANADGFDPAEPAPPVARATRARPLGAVAARGHGARSARDGLEEYDATGAGRRIQAFVDDLSNWYVRRSRRRFWNPGGATDDEDAPSAFHTLHTCLMTVAQLLAPFTPFIAEELWRNLAAGPGWRPGVGAPVRLSARRRRGDGHRSGRGDGGRARDRRARATCPSRDQVADRQPLAEAVVHYPGDHRGLAPVLPLIADELNVKQVLFAESDASFGTVARQA